MSDVREDILITLDGAEYKMCQIEKSYPYNYAVVGAISINPETKSVAIQLKYVTSNSKIFDNISKGAEQLEKATEFLRTVELQLVNMTYSEFNISREQTLLLNMSNNLYGPDINIRIRFSDGILKEY